MKWPCLICMLFVLYFSKPATGQTPAQKVPDFTLFKLDGTPFTRKQMPLGKASLFSFFDATCSHCRVTMQSLSKRYSELKGISIFLVTLDRKDALIKFINTYGPAFLNKNNVTILQDLNYEFIPKFQPVKYPSVFLYNKNKTLELYEKDDLKMSKIFSRIKSLEK
jgi:hypothetical protein